MSSGSRPAPAGRLTIDDLGFDPASGELTGPGGVARLAPQPAELLTLLSERRGAVVTKDDIKSHLWPGGKVEFEQGIAFAVREVRKAFEAVGGDPTLLQTIPRRGLRLNAPESVVPARERRRTYWARQLFGFGAVVISIVVIVLAKRGPTGPPPVLAIFPHDSEEAPDLAELAGSLALQLTTVATERYPNRLGVVGPTGTASLNGPGDTDGAQRVLSACLVLSGSLRHRGVDSVEVFTQIVRTSDRVHLWARNDTVPAAGAAAAVTPGITAGIGQALAGC